LEVCYHLIAYHSANNMKALIIIAVGVDGGMMATITVMEKGE
jgi:hypothetical protein